MGQLFKSMEFNKEEGRKSYGYLKNTDMWMNHLNEAVGVALWVISATMAGGSGWAWGFTFVMVNLTFNAKNELNLNILDNFMSVFRNDTSIVQHVMTFFFHAFGVIGACMLAEHLGFSGTDVPAHKLNFMGGEGMVGIFSKQAHHFLFGLEFIGLFMFTVWRAKGARPDDMPSSVWDMMMIALAFWIGGDAFVFVPARLFTSFDAFKAASTWAMVICQWWSVMFTNIILEYVWNGKW